MKRFYNLVAFSILSICLQSFAPPATPEEIAKRSTPAAQATMFAAIAIAQSEGASEVKPEHFLKALLRGYHVRDDDPHKSSNTPFIREHQQIIHDTAYGILVRSGVKSDENAVQTKLRVAFPAPSTRAAGTATGAAFADFIDRVEAISREYGGKQIWVPHILLALARDKAETGTFIKTVGASEKGIESAMLSAMGGPDANDEKSLFQLDKYGKDLVQLAREGKIDPAIGREEEIGKLITNLGLRSKPNSLLRGDPGVGKTQIVEGFAYQAAHFPESLPPHLKNVKIYAIDLGALIGGAKFQGEFEDRLKFVIAEVGKSPDPIVLFFDEIHVLAKLGGAQGGAGAIDLLKPALARGNVRAIGATTIDEYREYLEKDGAFERRFQFLDIDPSSVQETILILKEMREKLEKHHKIDYSVEALVAAARLSDRFVHDKALPDKAVGPADVAGSLLAREHAGAKPDEIHRLEKELLALNVELDLLKGEDAVTLKQRAALLEKIQRVEAELEGWQKAFIETQAALPRLIELKKQIDKLGGSLDGVGPADSQPIGSKMAEELDTLGVKLSEFSPGAEAYVAIRQKLDSLRTESAELIAGIDEHRKKYGLGYTQVEPIHVARVVAESRGIPLDIIATSDKERFLRAHLIMKQKVKHQDHAVEAVADAFNNRASGLGNPNKPIGGFIFLGPTGVGKTLLCKVAATDLFGDPKALLEINMANFTDPRTAVSALIGATAGYVGFGEKGGQGQLTEPVRQNPYRVVLLDEIDKAHPDVFTLLLKVMEDGFLQDSSGRMVDFRNTLFVLNGNMTEEELYQKFKKEVIGRFDEVITFHDMDLERMRGVAATVFEPVRARMLEAGVDTKLTPAALTSWLDLLRKTIWERAQPNH
ncbi:MAG: AAA family ATPase [Bdellovibrionota bacterium]